MATRGALAITVGMGGAQLLQIRRREGADQLGVELVNRCRYLGRLMPWLHSR